MTNYEKYVRKIFNAARNEKYFSNMTREQKSLATPNLNHKF